MARKCRICHQPYVPVRAMQPTCSSFDCQVEYAGSIARKSAEKREAAARKDLRERKEKLKTRRDYANEAQAAVNAFRRAEDELMGFPCISCGRHHKGQNHAGHYLSRGAHPEIALEPMNLHLQCAPCNTHLSGNQINYRKGLMQRYGADLVEWLESKHEPKHYTIDDLKRIRDEYRAKLKTLKGSK